MPGPPAQRMEGRRRRCFRIEPESRGNSESLEDCRGEAAKVKNRVIDGGNIRPKRAEVKRERNFFEIPGCCARLWQLTNRRALSCLLPLVKFISSMPSFRSAVT